MKDSIKKTNAEQQDRMVAEMRREQQERQAGYREQALKLFPPVCGRCGREFEGKKLRELTVHHKDHNHDNNPPDGSNWELLCIYCHDHEHTRGVQETRCEEAPSAAASRPSLAHSPFAALGSRMKKSR
ncbi:HNH endonuclease family protein [Syntrophotalea carbinolica DSM 2380]|uniref:Putative HNH nuclease YajD n=1 Tax=Syntrophotalea carbinolica (strain DSM 2380 / NBRC 103641 / GraBd1) TaxID=338963 RepID=Q3A280_SYNC1|nr:HNH endonuclease family protein [Syntrophotalea carbinolica DSM 2380]